MTIHSLFLAKLPVAVATLWLLAGSLSAATISTFAGTGERGYSGDGGLATNARINAPFGIARGPEGALYICDTFNHVIRRVKNGRISTVAGTPLNGPRAIDFAGHQMWLALREGNAVYRLDLKKGTIHHEAGTGKKGLTGNGGPAKQATLSGPKGIAVGPRGNVYLAGTESHTVRMINRKTGRLEMIAGDGKKGDGPEGDPLSCRMDRLHGIFEDRNDDIFIGDTNTHRVRIIRP